MNALAHEQRIVDALAQEIADRAFMDFIQTHAYRISQPPSRDEQPPSRQVRRAEARKAKKRGHS